MQFMVLIKATADSEAGVMPSTELLTAMGAFNEELVNAGIMKDGNGLHPSSKAARVNFDGDKVIVTDGPFAETKEVIAGYWLWEIGSLEEAIEWVKRVPNTDGGHSQIEIRQVFSPEDFGENLTPELAAAEEELRARVQE